MGTWVFPNMFAPAHIVQMCTKLYGSKGHVQLSPLRQKLPLNNPTERFLLEQKLRNGIQTNGFKCR